MRDWIEIGLDGAETGLGTAGFVSSTKIEAIQAAVESVIRGKSEVVRLALIGLFPVDIF